MVRAALWAREYRENVFQSEESVPFPLPPEVLILEGELEPLISWAQIQLIGGRPTYRSERSIPPNTQSNPSSLSCLAAEAGSLWVINPEKSFQVLNSTS